MPHFNDLHGLCVDERDGSLLVCNTGLDSVERIGENGRWLGRYAFTPPELEHARYEGKAIERLDFPTACTAGWDANGSDEICVTTPEGDYYDRQPDIPFIKRRVRDYLHPNHVFVSESHGPCATLLLSASVRSLTTLSDVIEAPGHPHDGIEAADGFWHTTVSGDVVRHTEDGPQTVLNLRDGPIRGWCRGLLLGAGWGAVGVTAMHGSDSLVPWSGGDRSETKTGIVWFDRQSGRVLDVLDMTDSRRRAKVFALIHDFG